MAQRRRSNDNEVPSVWFALADQVLKIEESNCHPYRDSMVVTWVLAQLIREAGERDDAKTSDPLAASNGEKPDLW